MTTQKSIKLGKEVSMLRFGEQFIDGYYCGVFRRQIKELDELPGNGTQVYIDALKAERIGEVSYLDHKIGVYVTAERFGVALCINNIFAMEKPGKYDGCGYLAVLILSITELEEIRRELTNADWDAFLKFIVAHELGHFRQAMNGYVRVVLPYHEYDADSVAIAQTGISPEQYKLFMRCLWKEVLVKMKMEGGLIDTKLKKTARVELIRRMKRGWKDSRKEKMVGLPVAVGLVGCLIDSVINK